MHASKADRIYSISSSTTYKLYHQGQAAYTLSVSISFIGKMEKNDNSYFIVIVISKVVNMQSLGIVSNIW